MASHTTITAGTQNYYVGLCMRYYNIFVDEVNIRIFVTYSNIVIVVLVKQRNKETNKRTNKFKYIVLRQDAIEPNSK